MLAFALGFALVAPVALSAFAQRKPSMSMSSADLDHFEKKVRPLLSKHCYTCHAGAAKMGGLSLDSGAGVKKGGASGAILVTGKPEESRIVQAVRPW